MEAVSRDFQIFVKPVGATCNLSCSYCYYLEKKDLYPVEGHQIMTDDMLEKYVIQHILATTESTISFSWHGGEPALAGIDFFRKVVKLQDKHKVAGTIITNGIQTNGTLLNDEWCRFLSNNKFTVGISIDGPDELHDKYRQTGGGRPTFQKVMKGFKQLKKYGIIPEILCVVNADNVKYPLEVYNLFRKSGAKFISFLPLVEPEPDSPGGVSRLSVPSEDFGIFLSTVFDEWVEKDIGNIKIQIFEEAARTAFDQEHTLCIFKENCGGVPVVEHTGDFYSCDHYVNAENLLGNIGDLSVSSLLDSERQLAFGNLKSSSLPKYCVECQFLSMCNGECPKNRIITTPDGESGLNYLCSGYKYFFNHCAPFVEAISEAWRNQG